MAKPITIPNTFASATSAIPLSQLDQDFSTLANSTNDLATYSNYVADTGAADAFIANYPANTNTSSLTTGLRLQFKAANANTGASTLNVQVNGASIGTASIRLTDGSALPANTIIAGALVDVMYDGTNFQIMNDPSGGQEIISNLTLSGNLTVAGTSTFTGNVTGNVVNTTTSTITNLSSGNVTITGGSIDNISITNLTSLTVDGNTTLGDASGDTLTINGTTVTTPNGLNFDSNTFVIDAANNRVGIGTASPAVALDVSGNATIANASAVLRINGSSGSPQLLFQLAGSNSSQLTDVGASGLLLQTIGGNPLLLGTNSTERMRITSAGLVGIGTSSPATRLHVTNSALSGFVSRTQSTATLENSGDTELYIASGASNVGQLRFGDTGGNFRGAISYDHSSDGFLFYTTGTERMRLDSSGNLGLGVTPSAWGSADKAIQVGAYTSLANDGNGSLALTSNAYESATNTWRYIASLGASRYRQNFGDHSWFIAPSGTAGNTITWTQAMTLDSSGNLGIGTSSPSAKLELAGTTTAVVQKLTATTGPAYAVYGNTGSNLFIGKENSAGGAFGAPAYASIFYEQGAYPMVFYTSSAERMRITSGGDIGIGTSSPTWKTTVVNGSTPRCLQLSQSTSNNADKYSFISAGHYTSTTYTDGFVLIGGVGSSGASAINIGGGIGEALASTVIQFYTAANNTTTVGTERMRIDSSGNVGIGTTSPASDGKLSVESNGSASSEINISLINGTSNKECILNFGKNLATADRYLGRIFYQVDNNVMGFWTNTTERMRITSDGNLLIGTTSNSRGARLRVDGSETSHFTGYGNGYGVGIYMTPNASATGTHTVISFQNPSATTVGTITSTSSATAYNTSSDYRLKENVAPMTGALEKVKQLKPCTYTWKVDGSSGQGFIAHELQEFAPYAVSGEKDGKEMQGVDYGKITPLLTAALQEALAKIESLEARLAALESK